MKNRARLIWIVSLAGIITSQSALSGIARKHLTPNIYGQAGVLRTASARVQDSSRQAFNTGFHFNYLVEQNFLSPYSTSLPEDVSRLSGIVSLTYTPWRFLEFSFAGHGFSSLNTTDDLLIQQIGNFRGGVKISHDFSDLYSVALLGEAYTTAPIGDKDIDQRTLSESIKFLSSFDLDRYLGYPVRLHVNTGYFFDTTHLITDEHDLRKYDLFLLSLLPYDQILYGIGVEYLLKYLLFFSEITGEYAIGSSGTSFANHPMRSTIGIKFFPTQKSNLSIDLGLDLAFFQDLQNDLLPQPSLTYWIGLTYRFATDRLNESFSKDDVVPNIVGYTISGKVIDKDTDLPLGSVLIKSPGTHLSPMITNPDSGRFNVIGVIRGKNVLTFEKSGYQRVERFFDLSNGPIPSVVVRMARFVGEIKIIDNRIVPPQKIQFKPGESYLTEESVVIISRIVDFIKSRPDLNRIRIEGHTDSSGSFERNILVSKRRAETIRDFFISKGLPKKMFEVVGVGPSRPIASNQTPHGREMNRRVELIIVAVKVPHPKPPVSPSTPIVPARPTKPLAMPSPTPDKARDKKTKPSEPPAQAPVQPPDPFGFSDPSTHTP